MDCETLSRLSLKLPDKCEHGIRLEKVKY